MGVMKYDLWWLHDLNHNLRNHTSSPYIMIEYKTFFHSIYYKWLKRKPLLSCTAWMYSIVKFCSLHILVLLGTWGQSAVLELELMDSWTSDQLPQVVIQYKITLWCLKKSVTPDMPPCILQVIGLFIYLYSKETQRRKKQLCV